MTAVIMVAGLIHGQDTTNATDWDALWQGIENTEFEGESDKLIAQSNLLLQWGAAIGWNRTQTWERAVELLNKWEVSPDIETARSKYLEILDAIGWAIHENGYFPAWESQLREYYQNALRITKTPQEESLFLFHLAASLYRSDPYSLDSMRRIEAYLEQAAFINTEPRLMGHIHLLMGKVYLDWSKRTDMPEREEASHGALAVYHFQQALALDGADPAVREQARNALDELLQTGLQLEISNRFHPDDDVRIKVVVRNLQEISVRVDSIPWQSNDIPLPIAQIESHLDSLEFDSLTTVFEQTRRVNTENRVDWEEVEIRIGDGLNAGWYAVEVSGDGLVDRALLLVTAIDLVVIPRKSGTLTIWTVDAQTADPVENGIYHVYDERAATLFSGRVDARGLADIVMGADQDWSEIHVAIDGNPAMIRRSDLVQGATAEPWLIPDAVTVLPGEELNWVLIPQDESGYEPVEDMLVLLPDGGVLIPQRVDGDNQNQYAVQLPGDVDQFGPLYLLHSDGRSTMLAHLLRNKQLPFNIDLDGERFSSDSNLFVSSTPVGIRVYPNDSDRTALPMYVRIQVEIMDRPFTTSAAGGRMHMDNSVAFEHITRFADPTVSEAFWELPEIEQTENMVALRVKVFPLGSDDLLAEAYLAMVPFRAKVSLDTSQQIIPVGDAVEIRILDVQRGEFYTRPLQGELIAYRESWENRYIHRKKGTPLSEEEFMALPDRSLLGTAKTDYRLVERGVVREEVLRQQVNLVSGTGIPISFERHGYYRIEFEGRDADLRADYPNGPLELWVLPESGALDAFQSAEPRLIVEDIPSGGKEVLVLADRTNASILVDLQFDDGHAESHVAEPGASGLYLLLEESSPSLETCLAAIARERQTAFLCDHMEMRRSPRWDVRMQRVTGLSPGSEFSWEAVLQEGSQDTNPVWVVYPEDDSRLAKNLILLQQREHSRQSIGCDKEATALDRKLPLFQPVAARPTVSGDQSLPVLNFDSSDTIEAVYPELRSHNVMNGGFISHHPLAGNESATVRELSGQVPSAAGRWSLMAFHPGSYTDMTVGEWEFSTDIPIRTLFAAPPIIRVGDHAVAALEIENTTRQTLDLQVALKSEGALSIDQSQQASFALPGGENIDLACLFQATTPGQGRLLASVQGASSDSAATLSTEVYQQLPYPAVQMQVVGVGERDHQERLDLEQVRSPEMLVSAGLGAHLDFIWSGIRDQYARHEPMLAALMDWAMAKVNRHHGLTLDQGEEETNKLLQALTNRPLEGGIRWIDGAPPDAWLSALVLWGIETFSVSGETFQQQREQMRSYLETTLIDPGVDAQGRLLVLRTLATRAANDPETRPSRIQAKTFLEFFQNREQLSAGNLAALMDTARAYQFTEEVRILQRLIVQRLEEQIDPGDMSLWDASLAYLALNQETVDVRLRYLPLQVVSDHVDLIAENPGWQQAGSLLNLLAAFFWEGDFSMEGSVTLQVGDGDPVNIDLRPHATNRGQWFSGELNSAPVSLHVDTMKSNQPVIITTMGKRLSRLERPPIPVVKIAFERQYVENTLLSGSHLKTTNTDLENVFQQGETLIQTIELETIQGGDYAEFQFNVAAGCSLAADAISYDHGETEPDSVIKQPEFILLPSTSPLYVRARLVPFLPGQHRFTLPFKINWSGEYILPAHELRFPDSGEVLRIGSQQTIKVDSD